jgi:hypothetical protein
MCHKCTKSILVSGILMVARSAIESGDVQLATELTMVAATNFETIASSVAGEDIGKCIDDMLRWISEAKAVDIN